MRTFRFSLVALAATALFTACSNDEAVQPIDGSAAQEISFRLQGGTPETRATATTLDNIDAFVVYGTDDITAPSTNLFNGVTVARQVGGGFDYNPKKYYNVGAGNAEFFAYSPVSAIQNITGLPTLSVLSGVSFNYEVVKPDDSGNTTQEDLLVAGTRIASITNGGVHFQFQHALSRIFVKAKNGLSQDVVITGLSLKNLYPEGTIAGTPGTPWTWVWTAYGTQTDYNYILAPTGVAVPVGTGVSAAPNDVPILVTSMEQGMMILPQTITTTGTGNYMVGDFALKVTYDVANLKAQEAYVYLGNGYKFDAGKQYAITIAFTGADLIEINFDIKVTDFTNDGTML